MDKIEYKRTKWLYDTEAANAEARRRAIWIRDHPDAGVRQSVWFSDLGALTALPQELAEIDGLERLFVGDADTPDGQSYDPPQVVSDWSALFRMSNLKELHAGDSGLDNLKPLQGCCELAILDLSHFKGTDLTPISGLSKLRSLILDGTQVTNLRPISDLLALSNLSLGGTQVRDLSPLSGLCALSTLTLSDTQVQDLSPLSGLSALKCLTLSDTPVSDLNPLSGLSALSSLRLYGTQVSDLSVLLSLPIFAALQAEALMFRETPLARSDRRWQKLSDLSVKTAAIEVVLYLKGAHPEFRGPLNETH